MGLLSAISIKDHKSVRTFDIKKVQRELVKIGNLPERVLTDKDFKGFSRSEMKKAIISVTDDYHGLEKLLTNKDLCIDLASSRIKQVSNMEDKVLLASILCSLGDDKYASVLAVSIRNCKTWDDGWNYTGMGQFGRCMSRLDSLIIALGRTRNPAYLSVIQEKAECLYPEDFFSHFRAVAMAMDDMKDKKAVPVLTEMITQPGVRSHAISSYREARNKTVPGDVDTSTRNKALKELCLARALYTCGDKDNIGKRVLERYANGLQAHYARFAYETLKG